MDTSDAQLRRLRQRLPIISTALAVVLFGVWYYAVIHRKSEYYVGRNLRLLSMVTSQIDDALAVQRGFIQNFAENDSWCKSPDEALSKYRLGAGNDDFGSRYLPGFEVATRSASASANAQPGFATRTFQRDGRSWLQVQYFSAPPAAESLVGQPNGKSAAVAEPRCALEGSKTATGEIELRTVVAPILQQALLGDFDSIFLVNASGDVLVQITPAGSRAIEADPRAPRNEIGRATTPLRIASIASLREQHFFSSETAIPLAEIQRQTRHADVDVGGTNYVFFSQPYAYAVPDGAGRWMICALMSRERFRHSVMTISPSLVTLIAALLLIALCSWPFLKLGLISDRNPITLADVILLTVGLLFGTAVITLMFADVFSYRRLRAINDYEHRSFAMAMKNDLTFEIGQALRAGKDLQKWSSDRIWEYRSLGDLAKDEDMRNQTRYSHIAAYPFFTEFAYIDNDGRQRYHGVMRGAPAPLVSVAFRSYFKEVGKRPWVWHERDSEFDLAPYYVESVRSVNSGKPEAVLSMPTGNPNLPVFTVTFPMVHALGPITPPGYQFAMIDEQGNVVFHYDETRNGVENFFTETDHDRELLSAVFAREEKFVNTTYLGNECRIRVTPVDGTPWTLLTIYNRRLLRVMNIEAVLITMAAVSIWVLLILLVICAISLVRPRYRAPWLWPDFDRADAWARLRLLLFLTAAAFAATIYLLPPVPSAISAAIVPGQALAASYLVLRRKWGAVTAAVTAVWMALTVAWLAVVFAGGIHPDLFRESARLVAEAALVVVIITIASFTLVRTKVFTAPTHYARCYVVCGVLGAAVVAMLPSVALFQAMYRSEMEGMIRFGQLSIGTQLQRRLDYLADTNWLKEPRTALSYEIPYFFQTLWCLDQAPQNASWVPCGNGSTAMKSMQATDRFDSHDSPFAALFEAMPSYSPDTYATRTLLHAAAADGSWRAWRSHRITAVTLPLRLAVETAKSTFDADQHPLYLTVVSRFPWLVTFDVKEADPIPPYARTDDARISPLPLPEPDPPLARVARAIGYAVPAAAVLVLVFSAVAFVARKVFLLDLLPPLPPGTVKLDRRLGTSVFVVGSIDVARYVAVEEFERVDLQQLTTAEAYQTRLADIETSANGARVLCVETGGDPDPEVTRHKLEFLERLLSKPNRTVVIVSRRTVPALVAAAARGRERERWAAVLGDFAWMNGSEFVDAPPSGAKTTTVASLWRDAVEWLKRPKDQPDVAVEIASQTNLDPLLSGTRRDNELQRAYPRITAAEICDIVSARTERYYESLWATCSSPERLALTQIAQHGIANGDNRRVLRRLLGRGLIRRTPELRLLNESFREFVFAHAAEVERECEEIIPASSWDRIRVPLTVLLFVATAVFLGTQRELLNITTAIASALAAGFPAIAKLIGSITGRRVAAGAAE